MSDAVLVALIAAIPPTLVAFAAYRQARVTHHLINSRMTELLETAAGRARAEGVAAGEQAQRDRSGPPVV